MQVEIMVSKEMFCMEVKLESQSTMPKHEDELGIIDIFNQGRILVAKWVVNTLEGDAPWKTILTHKNFQ